MMKNGSENLDKSPVSERYCIYLICVTRFIYTICIGYKAIFSIIHFTFVYLLNSHKHLFGTNSQYYTQSSSIVYVLFLLYILLTFTKDLFSHTYCLVYIFIFLC